MYKVIVPFGLLLLGTACGISDSVGLGELSESQQTKLCEELSDFETVTLDCEGITIELEPTPVSECETAYAAIPESCTANVGDARACIEAVKSATCDTDFTTGPCAAIFDASCVAAAE
ncbi:MAG: hypothetical protein R3F61_31995 [Myxococcota bacterium]